MNDERVGQVVSAEVTRVEPYGIYMRFSHGEILVLIPDVSHDPVPDLAARFAIGDRVEVGVLRYVEERKLYKATIKDA